MTGACAGRSRRWWSSRSSSQVSRSLPAAARPAQDRTWLTALGWCGVVAGVGNLIAPLLDNGQEMMAYHAVLDDHRFAVNDTYIRTIYGAFGWPSRLAKQVGGRGNNGGRMDGR